MSAGSVALPHTSHLPSKCDHGPGCGCLALAAAVHCDPHSLTFDFCLRVLQQHWRLDCHHGEPGSCPLHALAKADWRQLGRLDAVKAVLLTNA